MPAPKPKVKSRWTMSIPEAGFEFFELGRNASYAAAARGEIPWIRVGRLKRVPIAAMEEKLKEAGRSSGPAG